MKTPRRRDRGESSSFDNFRSGAEFNGEKSLEKDSSHTGTLPVYLKNYDSKTSELLVRIWEGVLLVRVLKGAKRPVLKYVGNL